MNDVHSSTLAVLWTSVEHDRPESGTLAADSVSPLLPRLATPPLAAATAAHAALAVACDKS